MEQYVQTYVLLASVGNMYFSHAYSFLTSPLTVSDHIICISERVGF